MTRAEAIAVTVYLFSRDADDLYYRYPRTDDELQEADRLKDEADRAWEDAKKLDADEGLWRRAVSLATGEPLPEDQP